MGGGAETKHKRVKAPSVPKIKSLPKSNACSTWIYNLSILLNEHCWITPATQVCHSKGVGSSGDRGAYDWPLSLRFSSFHTDFSKVTQKGVEFEVKPKESGFRF